MVIRSRSKKCNNDAAAINDSVSNTNGELGFDETKRTNQNTAFNDPETVNREHDRACREGVMCKTEEELDSQFLYRNERSNYQYADKTDDCAAQSCTRYYQL